MKLIIAALIWGVVNATMICKTSSNSRAAHNSPWSN